MQGAGIHIALCAGEPSGDKLAAQCVRQLREMLPQAKFYGVGGAQMAQAGVDIVADYAPLANMGYWDVLCALPRILRLRRQLLQATQQLPPHLFIGIDAPDFNLRIARQLRRRGSKCVQYVAPSVWMWRRARLTNIAAAVDAVLCLLPFEPPLFSAAGIAATYVGHPAAQREMPRRDAARKRLGIATDAQVVALLPGSRRSELARHLPLLRQALPALSAPGRCFVAAAASTAAQRQMQRALPQVICGELDDVLAAADVAVVKSGTVTLEAAMAGVPLVVFYRAARVAAWLVRWRRFYLPFFSLPNILSRRFIAAELLLEEATAANLVKETELLLADAARRERQQQQFARLRTQLASADATPAEAVAGWIGQG